MVGTSPRLVVKFVVGTALDLKAVRNSLCRSYRIGYVGLYDCELYISLYVQTASTGVRMTPAKVLKICKKHGEVIEEPTTFGRIEGIIVSEIGHFRRAGHREGSTARGAVSAAPTSSTVTKNGTTAKNGNTDIYISIHPVGKEDLSHITLDKFKSIIGGDKEELHRHMRAQHESENEYEFVIEKAWQAVHNVLFRKHCEKNHGPPVTEQAEQSVADDDQPSDKEGKEGSEYPMNTPEAMAEMDLDGQPLYYDSKEGSDYNLRIREQVGRVTMLDRYAADKSNDLLHMFGEMLFDNPHNVNVRHTNKSGSFDFFDGQTWRSEDLSKLYIIADNWQVKIREFYHLLEQRHGEDWTDSFHGFLAYKSIEMLRFWHPDCVDHGRSMNAEEKKQSIEARAKKRSIEAKAKRDALRVIRMANRRVNDIKRKKGKRVRMVLSETDFVARGEKVLRSTSWGELQSDP